MKDNATRIERQLKDYIKFQFGLKSVENADDLEMMALLQFQYIYN